MSINNNLVEDEGLFHCVPSQSRGQIYNDKNIVDLVFKSMDRISELEKHVKTLETDLKSIKNYLYEKGVNLENWKNEPSTIDKGESKDRVL